MIEKEKLQAAFDFARMNNIPWIEIDGIKMPVPEKTEIVADVSEAAMNAAYNPEPQFSDEEIMYYATPYFEELQEKKRIRSEQLKTKEDLDGKN
jgi:hypothetical protein